MNSLLLPAILLFSPVIAAQKFERKKQASRRSDWLAKSDFDNMAGTLERVKSATGIED